MNAKMRIVAIILAAAMLVTAFTACGSSETVSDAASNAAGTTSDETGDTGSEVAGTEDTESTASGETDSTASGETDSTTSAGGSSVGATANTSSKGGTTVTPGNKDDFEVEKPADTSADPLKQGHNLKGYVFKVIGVSNPFDTKKASTKEEKLKKELIETAQKQLNFKYQFVQAPYSKVYSTYRAKISSGQDIGSAIYVNQFEIGSFIAANLLKDIKKDLPHITEDAPYWNQNVAAGTTIKGKQYATTMGTDLYASQIVFFNKEIAKEIGAGNLYQLAKDKKFTIDKFIELCQKAYKDIDGANGKTKNDRYGLAQTHWNSSLSLFCGSGIKLLTEQNGKVVFNFKPTKTGAANQAAIDYMNKLKTVCYPGVNSVTDQPLNKFIEGKALFFTGQISNVTKMANMKQDFGILPTPNAKEGAGYYNWVDWNVCTFVVPKSHKKLEQASIVLEALAYHQYYDIQAVGLEDYAVRNFRDKESLDMMIYMQDMGMYDLCFFAGKADENINNIIQKIIVPSCEDKLGGGGYDPAQAIPMYEDKVRQAVDQFFNK